MDTTQSLETLNTLHTCAEIEETLGKMYDFFAETYRENPAISKIFAKTAAEERNHEYQIRLAIKTFAPAIEAMALTSEDADRHLVMVRETLEKLKHTIPDLEEALDLCITLESMSSHCHMDAAARFADQSCIKLFKAMMSADDAHVAYLEQALKKLRTTGNNPGTSR
jgi:rubrerythrin